MARKSWFQMSAVALESKPENAGEVPKGSARIDILGPIGGWDVSGAEFLRELRGLGEVENIDLRIHSPGGDVLDGWAIANALKNHPARVVTRVEGLAASMGSVIALAGDEVQMPKNGHLMIHNVSGGAFGGSEDLREVADLIDKLGEGIADFYVDRSGLDRETVVEMMDKETWMTGAEAVELGFADVVLDEVKAAASASDWEIANRFESMPEGIEVEDEEEEEEGEGEEKPSAMKNLLARLGIKGATETGGPDVTAAARVKSLEGRVEELTGELATAREERDEANKRAEESEATAKDLEQQAKTVEAHLVEAGFDFAGTEELPEPVGREGSEKPGGSVFDELEKLPKGSQARRDFYAANEQAILRAWTKRDKASGEG